MFTGITYQPTLPPDQLASLQQLVVASYVGSQRHLILSPYAGIPSPIVASAWGAQLDVKSVSDSSLVEFIQHYAGGARGGEQGGPCTGGVAAPRSDRGQSGGRGRVLAPGSVLAATRQRDYRRPDTS